MNLENEAYIEKDWITVENYQFKILVMIAALAENHLAYRGKLKDMCSFLGVCSCSKNHEKIKKAIENLEESGDIKVVRDKQTWTLTLSVKAERKTRIIKIKNAWIQAIQQYDPDEKEDSVAWENILKVLVYLVADKQEVKSYSKIADDLGISINVAKRAVKALDGIDFGNLEIKRKLAWLKKSDNEFKVIGQKIEVIRKFK